MWKFSDENIVFTKGFFKDFEKLSERQRTTIFQKLKRATNNEEILHIKKLIHYPDAEYRIRIGQFRILFSKDHDNKKYLFLSCKKRKDLY